MDYEWIVCTGIGRITIMAIYLMSLFESLESNGFIHCVVDLTSRITDCYYTEVALYILP